MIEMRKYPKIVEEFAKENFNLKSLLIALFLIALVNGVALILVLKRGPVVVPLLADGSIGQVDGRVTDSQIVAALKEYISARYSWTDETIGGQLKRAEFYVPSRLTGSFQKALAETRKFVSAKKVRQRVYPKSDDINLKDRTATFLLDRITEFDSLKAATEMRLVLEFELGDRSVKNPWGVFVTKETEEGPK